MHRHKITYLILCFVRKKNFIFQIWNENKFSFLRVWKMQFFFGWKIIKKMIREMNPHTTYFSHVTFERLALQNFSHPQEIKYKKKIRKTMWNWPSVYVKVYWRGHRTADTHQFNGRMTHPLSPSLHIIHTFHRTNYITASIRYFLHSSYTATVSN